MRYSGILSAIFAVAMIPVAFAQDAPAPGSLIDSQGGGAIAALPIQPKMAGSISYLSGGIGDEELAELRAKKSEYNVHVLMNVPAGNYVSDVAVDVHDSKGADAFNAGGTGPYLYFNLPPGKYTLEATSHGGDHKTAHFTIPAKGSANLHLVFKDTE